MVFPLLRPEDVAVRDFRVPANWKYRLIPGVAARLLRRLVWVLPAVDAGACTGCGDCVRVCAAGAMSLDGGRAVVNEDLCVSCLCCHEACPNFAVGTRMSRLARLLA
jgi:ferredoxin